MSQIPGRMRNAKSNVNLQEMYVMTSDLISMQNENMFYGFVYFAMFFFSQISLNLDRLHACTRIKNYKPQPGPSKQN